MMCVCEYKEIQESMKELFRRALKKRLCNPKIAVSHQTDTQNNPVLICLERNLERFQHSSIVFCKIFFQLLKIYQGSTGLYSLAGIS